MNLAKHNMEMHRVTVKEGAEVPAQYNNLSGRVLGAFFVQGGVRFALGLLKSITVCRSCTRWKNGLVLFAVVRRRQGGDRAGNFSCSRA